MTALLCYREPGMEAQVLDTAVEEIVDAIESFDFDELDDVRTLEDVRERVIDFFSQSGLDPSHSWEELAALAVVAHARGIA